MDSAKVGQEPAIADAEKKDEAVTIHAADANDTSGAVPEEVTQFVEAQSRLDHTRIVKLAAHVHNESAIEKKFLSIVGGPPKWVARPQRCMAVLIYGIILSGFIAYAIIYVLAKVAERKHPPINISYVQQDYAMPDLLVCVEHLHRYHSMVVTHSHAVETAVQVGDLDCIEVAFDPADALNWVHSGDLNVDVELAYVGESIGDIGVVLVVGNDVRQRHFLPSGPHNHSAGITSRLVLNRVEHTFLDSSLDYVEYPGRLSQMKNLFEDKADGHVEVCDEESSTCTLDPNYANDCSDPYIPGEICNFLFKVRIAYHGNMIQLVNEVDPLSVMDILGALGGYLVYVNLLYGWLFEMNPRSGDNWAYPTKFLQVMCCLKSCGYEDEFSGIVA